VPDLAGTHLQAAPHLGSSPLQIAAQPLEEFTQRLRQERRERSFLPWMAKRIRTAARSASDSDQLVAAVLRLRLAAERVRAADQAIAILDQRLLAVFERTGLGWLRGQIRSSGDVGLVNLFALIGAPTLRRGPLPVQAGREQPHRAQLGPVPGPWRHPPARPPAPAIARLPGRRLPGHCITLTSGTLLRPHPA